MNNTLQSTLSIAVPNKGRLNEESLRILRRAGLNVEVGSDRQLVASAWEGRVRVLFVRAKDIPVLVQDGRVDLGITGIDLVQETGAQVKPVLDLGFGACRLVAAVPEKSGIQTVEQLPDKLTVATSFPNLTRAWFEKQGRNATVMPVSGATEVMPHIGVADAIVDLTASGSTLAMNELVEIATLLRSTAWLIAHPPVLEDGKSEAVADLVFALKSVLSAAKQRYLMMDVPTSSLEAVRKLVPGIAGPTIMDIYGDQDMKAVHAVVREEEAYTLMRKLRSVGARGLLLLPIDRMVA